MEGNRTILDPPDQPLSSNRAIEKKPLVFSFGEHYSGARGHTPVARPVHIAQDARAPLTADKSYWSASSKDDPRYASQQTLFDDLGVELLNHSFEGFNTCIFACELCAMCGVGGALLTGRWADRKVSGVTFTSRRRTGLITACSGKSCEWGRRGRPPAEASG